jgi:hypothetical protein
VTTSTGGSLLYAPLSQELFDVAVGQAEAQVPADGDDDDDIAWEAEAGEVRPPRRAHPRDLIAEARWGFSMPRVGTTQL